MINDPALTQNERAIFCGPYKRNAGEGKGITMRASYNFLFMSAINDTIIGSMMVIYYEEM